MIPDPGVLERNLERLFSRSYAPVRPSAAYRGRLLAALERQLAVPTRRPRAATWRLAAAVVLGLGSAFLGWRLLHGQAAEVRVDDLLASGRPAVREGAAGAWRPLSDAEARQGVAFAGPALELATPVGASAQVVLGADGRLDAEGQSRVSLDAPAAGTLLVALDRGAIALERRATGGTWRVSTSEGSILLERGAIEVACLDSSGAREVRARLREGAAAAEVDPHTQIEVGGEVVLRGGRLIARPDLDPSQGGLAQRTSATASETEPPPAAPSADPATASLRGTIALPSGAEQPERFDVTLLRRERLPEVSRPRTKTFAGKDGAFAWEELRPGVYSVFVQVPGFAVSVLRDVELRAGPMPVEITVPLDLGVAVNGRVLDAEGRPLEGALVVSEEDAPVQVLPLALDAPSPGMASAAKTGSDGAFELPRLRRGRHHLRATHAGHGASWYPVDVADSSPAAVEIRLTRPGGIEGRVGHDDGSAWPGAVVIASLLDTTFERPCMSYGMAVADAEGSYRIADLPPGLCVVLNVLETGSTPGLASPRVVQVRIESGAYARVDLPAEALGTTLEGTLSGADGKPLAGLDITIVPEQKQRTNWKSGRSGADGGFSFPNLRPGTYLLFVGQDLGTRFTWQGALEVPAVPVFRHTLRVATGLLRGRVTEAQTGAGLGDSVIVLEVEEQGEYHFAAKTIADAEGTYAVRWLPPGRYRTTAYATKGRFGQETAEDVWMREEGVEVVQDFALAPGAELTVRVVDAAGAPVTAAGVRFLGAGGAATSFSPDDATDSNGLLRVRGFKPGRWIIRVSREHFRPAEAAVELFAGDEREVRIVLPSSD